MRRRIHGGKDTTVQNVMIRGKVRVKVLYLILRLLLIEKVRANLHV
jgi:hypothetical protein